MGERPQFLTWVNSEEHVRMVEPLHSCVRDTRSLRFHVVRETGGEGAAASASRRRLQTSPRIGDGVIRHALTFTVKPGSEAEVKRILANYASPQARVDETTRRAVPRCSCTATGSCGPSRCAATCSRRCGTSPGSPRCGPSRKAINPYLEQERDLNDQESARVFFTRAALPAVHHVTADKLAEGERRALYYPARPG